MCNNRVVPVHHEPQGGGLTRAVRYRKLAELSFEIVAEIFGLAVAWGSPGGNIVV